MYVVAHNGSSILGGGETGTALLLAGLQERGHRVLMLCRDPEMAGRIGSYGIPTGMQRIGGGAALPDALRFARTLRRHRPDAVILTTFKKVFLAGLGARLGGAPRVVQRIVLEGHTPRRPLYRLALRRFVDVVTLNAEEMRSAFLADDPRLDPEKVVTLYDGVRAPKRMKAAGAVRRELAIPEGALVVGAVARLARQKRFDRLVAVLSDLPAHVHCLVAGEGPWHDALRRLARERGVEDRLHLPGFRGDVGDVLDALDVFVVCSDREGMANAMLEAMAVGVPVLSTPVSGAPEALEPFPDGSAPGVVTGFAPEELRAALLSLLADPRLRERMGEAGRRRVRERFSYAGFLDRWEALLSGNGQVGEVRA